MSLIIGILAGRSCYTTKFLEMFRMIPCKTRNGQKCATISKTVRCGKEAPVRRPRLATFDCFQEREISYNFAIMAKTTEEERYFSRIDFQVASLRNLYNKPTTKRRMADVQDLKNLGKEIKILLAVTLKSRQKRNDSDLKEAVTK